MNSNLKHNWHTRALGLGLFAGIATAVATMFVPAAALESITGASGLSELIPATAAPLGDTARALIAFGTGAIVLALMTVLLLRVSSAKEIDIAPTAEMAEDDDGNLAASIKQRIANLRLPKMPWVKGNDDITELSDLPKLRGGDSHPDAPARRPLLATQDLPVLDLTELAVEAVIEPEPVALASDVADHPVATDRPSLAEMIEQLEASVAQRQKQLAELEIVAAKLASSKLSEPSAVVEVEATETPSPPVEVKPPVEVQRPERPPLEAVPDNLEHPDDMDEALAAALATLHRMNGTGR